MRHSHIQKSLIWFKYNNRKYEDIIIDQNVLNELPEDDIPDTLFNEIGILKMI